MKEIGRYFKRGFIRRDFRLAPEHEQWVEDFMALIGPEQSGGCWPWMGNCQEHRRGVFWLSGRKYLAAQLALIISGRPRPDCGCALHKCDNPNCVNPDHLWWGTQRENMADMAAKGRANAPRGMKSPLAKLTDDQVREIRKSVGPQRIVGARFGVDPSKVSLIRNRKAWAHVED